MNMFKDMKELIQEQTNQINQIRKLLDDLEENQRILTEKMDKIKISISSDCGSYDSDNDSSEISSMRSMFDKIDEDCEEYELDYNNMNISENLYVALGLSQIERQRNSNTEVQEWRPPTRSGLDNSSRLV